MSQLFKCRSGKLSQLLSSPTPELAQLWQLNAAVPEDRLETGTNTAVGARGKMVVVMAEKSFCREIAFMTTADEMVS